MVSRFASMDILVEETQPPDGCVSSALHNRGKDLDDREPELPKEVPTLSPNPTAAGGRCSPS